MKTEAMATKTKELKEILERKSSQMYTIVKRDGKIVPFQRLRIELALESAFRDTKKIPEALPLEIAGVIDEIATLVTDEALNLAKKGVVLTVEGIQDIVEVKLMEKGHHDVAKDYIIYRQERKQLREDSPRLLKVMKRNGTSFVRFNPMKIAAALEKGFRDTLHLEGPTPDDVAEAINRLTSALTDFAVLSSKEGKILSVEMIQDEIERLLMREGHYKIARDYILYRERRAEERKRGEEEVEEAPLPKEVSTSHESIRRRIVFACKRYPTLVSANDVFDSAIANFYEGIKDEEVDLATILAARAKIEAEPCYTYVAAGLLLDVLYRESLGIEASSPKLKEAHKKYFCDYFKKGVSVKRLDPALLSFDLEKLSNAIDLERDHQFTYLGLQTLYDRYFISHEDRRLETPQIFWMRVAMGLSLTEGAQKEERAIEFYNVLSKFLFISGTPTLFNAGTLHSQLSSCYLSTVMDDLGHIYKVVADDAQLSKWAGGLGNDWTNVRATGAMIKGTNGRSQGVIPFLKVANDTAVAVNQGGKRKGAMCAYLETWHLDIEDFLELRKNTGDERRRTHDMNTANWIPDLFMKRVLSGGTWTLFSPNDVPDLHHIWGQAFEKKYLEYEKMADRGQIKLFKRIEALNLWRKMLGMLYETGHPWITFKDPSNIRSPQDHVGVVHSSNLCTEILLNTSAEETAVCNLGSINLAAHMTSKGIQRDLLASTVKTAIRMLDNVVDINFYPTEEAKRANLRHRPVGLGLMGFQDALYILNVSYASEAAVEFADESMELISYYAILASSELAKERGTYSSYKGSKWERGILPIDSVELLAKERGPEFLDMDTKATLDWAPVREAVKKHGMRNSNTMAIAPTATIANIIGITQSIEPMYKHLFVKSNLSGEFTVLNPFLVDKLKEMGIWDADMIDDLKYFDGSIAEIERIPEEVKRVFLTAFEIEPDWIIECGARRQKWIDMGESLNLYLAEPSGKKLNQMYLLAWKKGLKTTYYLRAMAATHVEKSTTDINKRGIQPRWMKSESPSSRIVVDREPVVKACKIGDESCESCQ